VAPPLARLWPGGPVVGPALACIGQNIGNLTLAAEAGDPAVGPALARWPRRWPGFGPALSQNS